MGLAEQIVEFLDNNDLSKTNKINWVQDRLNELDYNYGDTTHR